MKTVEFYYSKYLGSQSIIFVGHAKFVITDWSQVWLCELRGKIQKASSVKRAICSGM